MSSHPAWSARARPPTSSVPRSTREGGAGRPPSLFEVPLERDPPRTREDGHTADREQCRAEHEETCTAADADQDACRDDQLAPGLVGESTPAD